MAKAITKAVSGQSGGQAKRPEERDAIAGRRGGETNAQWATRLAREEGQLRLEFRPVPETKSVGEALPVVQRAKVPPLAVVRANDQPVITRTDNTVFQHAAFCVISFPRSACDAEEYERSNPYMSLSISAGKLLIDGIWEKQCVPYGVLPRLVLAHICTQAVRHRTRTIPIARTAGGFLADMDFDARSGRNYRSLRKQIHALAACRIQIGVGNRTITSQPVEHFDAWAARASDAQGRYVSWPGEIQLSEPYYNQLIEHAVPLDERALLQLKSSAMALDIYQFAAYRLHELDADLFLTWNQLKDQFGSEFSSCKNFRVHFLRHLVDVLAVYPGARIDIFRAGGVCFRPSHPPVPYAGRRSVTRLYG